MDSLTTDSNPQTQREKVYDFLREKMACGELRSGTRLVNRTIASSVGTSFAPVREAICQLLSDGLVEQVPGAGAYVKLPNRREIEELLVVREELEGRAAQEAAQHISERQLENLQAICDQWRETLHKRRAPDSCFELTAEEIDEWIETDRRFHETIIRAANNRVLARTLGNVKLLSRIFDTMRVQEAEFQDFSPISWPRIWREHAALVRALRRGDGAEARRRMVLQVLETKQQFMDYFDYKEQR
ncbi:GntR family transcriptional regulator [Pirellulales bacterium]|nr:GntR family transcriptional regulator [Pirellulales bacterium]